MKEQKEATFLGKKTEYKFSYDKTLIVPVLREEERVKINIDSNNLIFKGFDVWNAYEFSTLLTNGLPAIGILKLKYPCTSKYLVESKSLKLYLNGYSMTKTGENVEDALSFCEKQIASDLSDALETDVQVKIFDELSMVATRFITKTEYENLTDLVNPDVTCTTYKEDPSLLRISGTYQYYIEDCIYTPLVRSCCKITHQPDFGTYYIKYFGKNKVDSTSLLQYLISFRDEWHFHEECTELVYKRLTDLLSPDELCVACFYTRRGGIDINVIRTSSMFYADNDWGNYLNMQVPSFKLIRQ